MYDVNEMRRTDRSRWSPAQLVIEAERGKANVVGRTVPMVAVMQMHRSSRADGAHLGES